MDGAVPGKVGEKPVLIWNLQTLERSGVSIGPATVNGYAIVSDGETGQLSLVSVDEVSVDWRLVNGEWVALYEPVEESEETTETEVETTEET